MSALTRATLTATAAFLVPAMLLAGCGSGSPSASAGPPVAVVGTKVVDVSPVTSAGVPARGFRSVTVTASASCIPGSEAIGRAYRCFAGNEVYDPCWPIRTATSGTSTASATATVLECLLAPWSHTTDRITVTTGLGPIPAMGQVTEPWGVQLANGTRCMLEQGAHMPFRGTPIDYYCGPDLSLLHGLSKASRVWSARSVRISKSGHMSAGPDEKITIAWFGRPVRYTS